MPARGLWRRAPPLAANGAKAPGHRSERGRFSCQRLASGRRSCVFCGARAWRRSAASWARQRLGFPPGARRSFAGARRRSKPARRMSWTRRTPGSRPRWANSRWRAESPAGEEPPGRPPFSRQEVEAMSQARFTSTGRAYGLKRVCALWGLARSTVYAQRRREAVPVHEPPRPISAALWARAPMRNSSATSGRSWRTLPSMARATARCGRGCASRASAPARSGCVA